MFWTPARATITLKPNWRQVVATITATRAQVLSANQLGPSCMVWMKPSWSRP